MELERWAELSAAISAVAVGFERHKRDQHSTALIVRVHTWAALHDRPISWACEAAHWTPRTRPKALPKQSTMSRRMRRPDFEDFQRRVGRRLDGKPAAAEPALVKVVDGKALELPNHSSDRDATWSRGVSRTSLGYKLHAICSGNPMPDAFTITTLNACEKRMAARMLGRVAGGGYLLGDAHFDASWLFDYCHHHGHQLVCPRAKPGTGIGHHYVSPHRRRAIDLLEVSPAVNPFGTGLYCRRTDVERDFSGLVCSGGGLAALPPWVRRIWRVRAWVTAKLLINAARIRLNRKKAS
jgi:Transposase DDE domain